MLTNLLINLNNIASSYLLKSLIVKVFTSELSIRSQLFLSVFSFKHFELGFFRLSSLGQGT